VGDILSDDVEVYRAFAEKAFRRRPKEVRQKTYFLRDEDVNDGLSVGITPQGAVRNLATNEGYCKIRVGDIHSLKLGLEVRADLNDPEHAFICHLPLMTISDGEREQAVFVARRLADASEIVTCDPYIP
jgi:hypothetical protein